MGMADAVRSFFKRYTDFQGRSSRSEFWWVWLAMMIVTLVLEVPFLMDPRGALGMIFGLLLAVFGLATLVPGLALSFRRLHDIEKSAWWLLIALIPFGAIVLLVFYVLPGTKGENKFGPDPLAGEGLAAPVAA